MNTSDPALRPPDAVGAQWPTSIRATWMRGGTSKCWVFRTEDLPADRASRDELLIRLFGSPDPRQIDGVGGATSTTSKALIVCGYSEAANCVEYLFAQVSVEHRSVEWDGNCGNCATALALYSAQEGYGRTTEAGTQLDLLNTMTGLRTTVELDPHAATIVQRLDTYVPGTVYPGSRVNIQFDSMSWGTYGDTFPTGRPVDIFTVDGRDLHVTLIDAGAPAALIRASDLGIEALAPDTRDIDDRIEMLVSLRHDAAARMGISGSGQGEMQSMPKIGFVAPPGRNSQNDIEARMVSMSAAHPSIGITSSIAIAFAAYTNGTTAHDVAVVRDMNSIAIGTPKGPLRVAATRNDVGEITRLLCVRSARRIADATLMVPHQGVREQAANVGAHVLAEDDC